jgi:uncharacterized protein YjbJ (UPF0337 family)
MLSNFILRLLKEGMMNWDEIEANWLKVKGEIKERWGRLTDDDLDVISGKRDKLAAEIQRKYAIAEDEANEEIEEFLRRERTRTH